MKNAITTPLEKLVFGVMKNSAAGSFSPTQLPQLVGSFAWLESLTLDELAEVRPHAVAGANGKPIRDPEGWQLRPQNGTATKLNLGFLNQGAWKAALARIDERLGPARAAAATKVQLKLPAAKATTAAPARSSAAAPAVTTKAPAPKTQREKLADALAQLRAHTNTKRN